MLGFNTGRSFMGIPTTNRNLYEANKFAWERVLHGTYPFLWLKENWFSQQEWCVSTVDFLSRKRSVNTSTDLTCPDAVEITASWGFQQLTWGSSMIIQREHGWCGSWVTKPIMWRLFTCNRIPLGTGGWWFPAFVQWLVNPYWTSWVSRGKTNCNIYAERKIWKKKWMAGG